MSTLRGRSGLTCDQWELAKKFLRYLSSAGRGHRGAGRGLALAMCRTACYGLCKRERVGWICLIDIAPLAEDLQKRGNLDLTEWYVDGTDADAKIEA